MANNPNDTKDDLNNGRLPPLSTSDKKKKPGLVFVASCSESTHFDSGSILSYSRRKSVQTEAPNVSEKKHMK